MLEIYVEAELKNKVVDLFLEKGLDNFFCLNVQRYAAKNLLVSQMEQVSGRKEYVMFKVFAKKKQKREILLWLEEFDHARYFVSKKKEKEK
ncbi:DUF3240 family protein [Helicobacter mustelae]|uniref:Uncharacterized protein n=1 Tax=Helicobacter mustelae (strain ATCC 43772 / CCUG 25715 / CIP 103759 / LMG 18044 / NCTC 12198 / R85-136P) TaxID=679897 RepID=D3UHQ1_HELM1|nr:DUF3240 family protein [Helicobacter mustelae]CBG40023.1 Putative hypothetical protein [Helicobacter mustelae 12198]SQH71535.1 Protein of uncharacterised function (DUF3240) [Helicobacter mustelae]STP12660.1 Protein of uncharacterised function (DUF3240) [Helicobacter mustelae]